MNPQVYVIDDEDSVRDSLSALLDAAGHRTQSFANASDFLTAFSRSESDDPRCLLVDIGLPDMNGLDLLTELHRRDASIPAIVMTGHGEEEFEPIARKQKAIAYFQKPFDTSDLLNVVSGIVDPAR